MNEVDKIKKWLCDKSNVLHFEVEHALWARRDNLLFRQGFITGAIITGLISAVIIAVIVTQ